MTMQCIAAHELEPTPASPAPASTPIVFVVDDDISIRESLAPLIECIGLRSACFASAREFLAQPRPLVPSCLVLDINLPDLSGLDLQERVAADRSDLPIIFITGYGDVPKTVRAMKAGALDLLTKPLDDEALLSAIRRALERSRAVLDNEDHMRALKERYASLSRREREVMELVVAGRLNKQVGSDLGISEITVKAHRGSVMRKMDASSLPSLVNMAARLGLPAPRR